MKEQKLSLQKKNKPISCPDVLERMQQQWRAVRGCSLLRWVSLSWYEPLCDGYCLSLDPECALYSQICKTFSHLSILFVPFQTLGDKDDLEIMGVSFTQFGASECWQMLSPRKPCHKVGVDLSPTYLDVLQEHSLSSAQSTHPLTNLGLFLVLTWDKTWK